MSVKVGIIGLGKMGILHAAQLKTIKDATLVAAADKEKRLAHYSKNVNPNIPFFFDIEKMFSSVSLDAVYICTPAFTHPELSSLLLILNCPLYALATEFINLSRNLWRNL